MQGPELVHPAQCKISAGLTTCRRCRGPSHLRLRRSAPVFPKRGKRCVWLRAAITPSRSSGVSEAEISRAHDAPRILKRQINTAKKCSQTARRLGLWGYPQLSPSGVPKILAFEFNEGPGELILLRVRLQRVVTG